MRKNNRAARAARISADFCDVSSRTFFQTYLPSNLGYVYDQLKNWTGHVFHTELSNISALFTANLLTGWISSLISGYQIWSRQIFLLDEWYEEDASTPPPLCAAASHVIAICKMIFSTFQGGNKREKTRLPFSLLSRKLSRFHSNKPQGVPTVLLKLLTVLAKNSSLSLTSECLNG